MQTLIGLMMVLVMGLALLPGCLVTSESDTHHSGVNVAPETFAQIKIGTTTTGWVGATLGPATSTVKHDDDEVWKYVYTEHTDSSGAIFLIFGGSSSNETTQTVFIEFKNGIVINKWRG